MPVTYQNERPKQLLRTCCTGAATLEDVLQHFAVLTQDPNCPSGVPVN